MSSVDYGPNYGPSGEALDARLEAVEAPARRLLQLDHSLEIRWRRVGRAESSGFTPLLRLLFVALLLRSGVNVKGDVCTLSAQRLYAIKGNQRHSEVIRGTQRSSEALRCTSAPFAAP